MDSGEISMKGKAFVERFAPAYWDTNRSYLKYTSNIVTATEKQASLSFPTSLFNV